MSLWDRFKGALKPPPPPPQPEPEPPAPLDETWLRNLLARLAEGDQAAANDIGGSSFWAAIARLQATGRDRTVIDLLGRFAAARPDDMTLKARLAELLVERRDDTAARPILEKLLGSAPHRQRAHYLLGELCERAGDEDAARRHYEAILAVDLDDKRARARADALRRSPPPKLPETAAPTIAGLAGPEGEGGISFGGRYRLVKEIGRGASGAVYVAHDLRLDRDLALKILHPHARARGAAEARARAWLEARLAAGVRHPGVVAIYDLDEDRQLLAMELCRGGPLRELLSRGRLDVESALRRAAELCETLAAVHQRGVVHGDVKPANLLFRGSSTEGDLVLSDFGIARLTGESSVVDDRGARGTLAYMSPEQRRGELPPAADVHAAGVLTVELLAGTRALEPWLGDRHALLRGTARWDGRFPVEVERALGDRAGTLRELVASMLATDAGARPDASSVARALRAMLRG